MLASLYFAKLNRRWLAYDCGLVSDVLHIFMQSVFSSLRRRARKLCGLSRTQCGAVTFVQRFGGAINLNVHFHILLPDGVYWKDDAERIKFTRLPPPEDSELARITERIARRILRLLERRGLVPEEGPAEADPFSGEEPLLAQLYSDSVQGRISAGPKQGWYLAIAGRELDLSQGTGRKVRGSAKISGFSLHANACIPANARRQLENLCRYAARPAVATERLSVLDDGQVSYELRHRWRNAATHVLFEPLDLVAKLAALVPPPRFNLVRHHGVPAPGARWRKNVVPALGDGPVRELECRCSDKKEGAGGKEGSRVHERNYSWAELLKRVFEIDVLECPECGSRMRILCAVNPPEAIRKILDCLGLPTRPPPRLRNRFGRQTGHLPSRTGNIF